VVLGLSDAKKSRASPAVKIWTIAVQKVKALKKQGLQCQGCLCFFWAKWFRIWQFFWKWTFQWHWCETVWLVMVTIVLAT